MPSASVLKSRPLTAIANRIKASPATAYEPADSPPVRGDTSSAPQDDTEQRDDRNAAQASPRPSSSAIPAPSPATARRRTTRSLPSRYRTRSPLEREAAPLIAIDVHRAALSASRSARPLSWRSAPTMVRSQISESPTTKRMSVYPSQKYSTFMRRYSRRPAQPRRRQRHQVSRQRLPPRRILKAVRNDWRASATRSKYR